MNLSDNKQKQSPTTDDVLLCREFQLGSGDTKSKMLPKIISAAIHRFQNLKKSDSQYLRRLLSLKQQVEFLPSDSTEKAFVNSALLKSVYELNERTRIQNMPDTVAKKIKSIKPSTVKTKYPMCCQH
ncbi:hypothetical protein TNIN_370511 [Trichonephila inaurata madagascariensis]|uniref:Uncharacterized protein n=1 Tax=Trichonephila inaurata madagascariensis TaxID=2747483 RepID=A0A8X6XAG0_9ARAC|nr:hypothetical protein TNIN_370511 [Trichonephila inaurata madagascariensis]